MYCIERYVKNKNIKSYLSFNDLEEIKICMNENDMQEYEEQIGWNERVDTLEDYIYDMIQEYNYKLATKNEDIKMLLSYIYGCEFEVEINKDGKLNLIDMQGAYLGGRESYENFDTIANALERLSGSFLYDYYGIGIA